MPHTTDLAEVTSTAELEALLGRPEPARRDQGPAGAASAGP